jgi:hypothetical protein
MGGESERDMDFRFLLQRIRLGAMKLCGCVSEEADLTAEVERLDREEPDWDHQARVAACTAGLLSGMHRQMMMEIYGDKIVAEAEAAIWHDKGQK